MAEHSPPFDQGGAQPEPTVDPGAGTGQDAELAGSGEFLAGPTGSAAVPLWRRPGARVTIGLIVAALVALGLVIQHVAAPGPKGRVSLPSVLIGATEDSGQDGRAQAAEFGRALAAANKGLLVNVVAASYPSAALSGFTPAGFGSGLMVAGGGLCGTCTPLPASQVQINLLAAGYMDAQQFSPDPKGGSLICYTQSSIQLNPQGGQPSQTYLTVQCEWADSRTIGAVRFGSGFVSSLAQGAKVARQIRAAVEH